MTNSGDNNTLLGLMTANFTLESIGRFLGSLAPIASALLPWAQLGVALVTIGYVWHKWHSARKRK